MRTAWTLNENDQPDGPALGPCCNCGLIGRAGNIVMLDRRGPTPGKGWGCVVCGLPCDGALVVLCDDCVDVWPPKFVCTGYPATDGRQPFDTLPEEEFTHDLSKHAEG